MFLQFSIMVLIYKGLRLFVLKPYFGDKLIFNQVLELIYNQVLELICLLKILDDSIVT